MAICGSCVPASAAAPASSSVLVLGRISDDPRSHYEQLRPLLDYVVPRMRDVGITGGRILMARNAQQMASYLRRGQVDWVTETPGTAMALAQRSGAHVLLLNERDGARQYRSLLFVRKDSDVHSLADLRGRRVALESTLSTSAYLLPLMDMLDARLHPGILLSPRDQPAPDSVGYALAGSATAIPAYVHKRLVDCGALNEIEWNDDRVMPAGFRRDMRIIHESAPVPRAVELVRAGMDERVARRLQDVLLQARDDPQAAPALRRFFATSGFRRMDAESGRQLERLRRGVDRVRLEVE
ncbi:phosphate/phosphite/phosphonate ABC transporter substrate-binding protein [Stenotrophomonas sp. MMGLT7]|uniref:phosphate/phosphite/phosphonate ABC transporter substrate-binding protein n=1 Tax=Stenotrophomonas sp. MMGLT7 TaxID=2901227 RepID=UPI001E65DCB8|nr:phosphate/phosphite/phosphonate ABC transporter substrate-binding protein [Stenotrophomonas sp. MMGLT7]MCD7100317.1 phosphate/phosphite/phosphonate ABC transporter substrate-binding protein [Stenotrophomonas sp. MMGLT7]